MLTRLRRTFARLRLGTLRQRIALIVLIHAALMFTISVLAVRMGGQQAEHVYRLPEPDRVAAIVLAFERAPPETYQDLLRAVEDERFKVALVGALPPPTPIRPEETSRREASRELASALDGRPFRILVEEDDTLGSILDRPIFSRTPFRVIVGLANGQALVFEQTVVQPAARLISNLTYFLTALFVFDILVVFWLAAQSTIPVERLVRAVRADAPEAMALRGAVEFVELGTAFRDMHRRLHGLIAERTRIIAAVAHDFRTYLTRLELRSDFIADEEQRKRALGDLAEMRQLMDDTLVFATPPRSEDTENRTDVRRAIESFAAGLRQTRLPEHRLKLDLPAPGTFAHATPMAFQRILANLVENAIRYGGGSVRIAAAVAGEDVLVTVEDEGPGVAPADLPSLTEPFVRLETSRARHTGGVGLGLSIVQAMAHRFGGDFLLENRPEGGLRARLVLRRA